MIAMWKVNWAIQGRKTAIHAMFRKNFGALIRGSFLWEVYSFSVHSGGVLSYWRAKPEQLSSRSSGAMMAMVEAMDSGA